jgi:hypothetical protein
MPAIILSASSGPFEVFLNAGAAVWAGVVVPDMLANPDTGTTGTELIYWEPWPATEIEVDQHGNPAPTSFIYERQSCEYSPDGNPQSPAGASLIFWKEITNPGKAEQSFIMLYSSLP